MIIRAFGLCVIYRDVTEAEKKRNVRRIVFAFLFDSVSVRIEPAINCDYSLSLIMPTTDTRTRANVDQSNAFMYYGKRSPGVQ